MPSPMKIPLDHDLYFLVDDADYSQLSKQEWAIENGRVHVQGNKPSWMSHRCLARHLTQARDGEWVRYQNHRLLDLTRKNVEALRPDAWHAARKASPPPDLEIKEPTLVGTAWAPRFQAWTTPYFARNPGDAAAEFFAHEKDVIPFAEVQRRRFDAGERWLGPSFDVRPEGVRIADQYSRIPLYRSASLATVGTDERFMNSASLVWLALRFFAQGHAVTNCYASLEAIRRMLGFARPETVSDGLKNLRRLGVIDFQGRRSTRTIRNGETYLRPWACHQVDLLRRPSLDELRSEPGVFPAKLFNNERFHDLSPKAKVVFLAICTLSPGGRPVGLSFERIWGEALLRERSGHEALKELSNANLITAYVPCAPGQHYGTQRDRMRLAVVV